MAEKPLLEMTPQELAKEWCRQCRRHDSLVDVADLGDERIYFAQRALDAVEAEFRRRGLSHHPYVRAEEEAHG